MRVKPEEEKGFQPHGKEEMTSGKHFPCIRRIWRKSKLKRNVLSPPLLSYSPALEQQKLTREESTGQSPSPVVNFPSKNRSSKGGRSEEEKMDEVKRMRQRREEDVTNLCEAHYF